MYINTSGRVAPITLIPLLRYESLEVPKEKKTIKAWLCFCLPTVLQREHVFPIIKFTKVKYIFYNFIVPLVMWMFQSQRAYSSQNTGSKFLCLWLFDGYFFFIKVVCSEIWWLLPYWQIKTVLLLNQTIQMVPCSQCSFRC